MPRNKSEKVARVLLEKQVTPASWDIAQTVQMLVLPDGTHKVRIQESRADGARWHSVVMPHHADALKVYCDMANGFYFQQITNLTWLYYGAS